MSYSFTPLQDGYRAMFQLDLPPGSMVYRTNALMVQIGPLPPLVSGIQNYGDLSSTNVIVAGKEGKFVLAGAVTAFRSMTVFNARFINRRLVSIEAYQPHIRQGDTPEEMVILEGEDYRDLLEHYADLAAEKMGVKPIESTRNMTGYCSWYYYYKNVTQQDMLENVEALTRNRTPYEAGYVQIDDGYQTFQGDWLDQCESWPVPVKEVAQKIISGGMKAGIWTMPTTASTASRVYREHPDWFVKKSNGETAILPGWSPPPDHQWACLDATIPAVREHIANVFKTFREWGFTYFKMDGLYFGLQEGVRQDKNATPVSAFRLLLKTIRDAVPDCILMGCSEPFLPCLGLVDNARVSNDTSRHFRTPGQTPGNGPYTLGCSIVDTFRIALSNFWLFDRWFRADPEVIMTRQDNAFYTRNQAKISVLGGIMTGVALTSDHLGRINPDRNQLLAKAQNIRMRSVRPLFPVPNVCPMEFEGTIEGKPAVALVNDSGTEKTWKLEDLGLSSRCTDLLEDKEILHEVTLADGDAVLLVNR